MRLDEYTDITFSVLQNTIYKYLQEAQAAPNEKMRREMLQQVNYIEQDWINYSSQHGFGERSLETGQPQVREPQVREPQTQSAPIVNHRREAILAQRARNQNDG